MLELLVVLLIAASAVALVMPQLPGARLPILLKGGARELAAALRASRSEAIARQREVAFTLDPATRARLEPLTVEIAGGADGAIRFFPDGSSSGGRIVLAAAGRTASVEVHWLTGKVAIAQSGRQESVRE